MSEHIHLCVKVCGSACACVRIKVYAYVNYMQVLAYT